MPTDASSHSTQSRRATSAACAAGVRAVLALLLAWLPLAGLALDPRIPFRDYVLDNWSTAHGLPQISVESIAQDRDGFLWVGTQNGIARFDGMHFQAYGSQRTGVDASLVAAAWGDASGAVWFGTSRGLLREREGHFEQWSIGGVNAITGGPDDAPVLATNAGAGIWRDGALHRLPGMRGPFFTVLRIGGATWAGGVDRLCRNDAAGTRCFALPGASSRRVTALARDVNALWVGTSTGLLRFSADRFDTRPPIAQLATTDIQALLDDRAGNLWIGSIAALYRRYPDGRLERIAKDSFPANPWIEALFEDREGNLWLGSRTQSLYRASDSWTRRYGRDAGLNDPFVWSLAPAPDGAVDVGTNSGLSVLRNGRAQVLVPGSALPNPAVYDLYRDAQGRLWIGTRGGVALWEHGHLRKPAALASLDAWQIDDILEWPLGTYWFGTHGGLFRLQDRMLTRFGSANGSALRVRALLPLAGGALLLGTEEGVREWRDGVLSSPGWAAPLRGHFVTGFGWLDPHTLLLTTLDAGLGLLHGGRLRMLTERDGLPGNNAWAVTVHQDQAYFSSINGVWRLPLPRLLAIARGTVPERVDADAVLTGNNSIGDEQRTRCCNGGGGGRMLRDGATLWLPSINGALALDLAAVRKPAPPGTPHVERLRHAHEWYAANARVQLPRGERSLEIGYTVPYLRNAARLQFRYRLLGYDNDWVNAGIRRTAWYTRLPPGHYRFEVEVHAGLGKWSAPTRLEIDLPAFWYEWRWLQIAGATLAAILLLLAARWHLHRQALRQRRLEALIDQRTEALRRANERLRQANDALTAESLSDALTGLGNRRMLAQQWHALRRETSLAVVLIDLDHFKRINDHYGHGVGDVVLREVAGLVQRLKDPRDLALRWGGEEFLLLLPGADTAHALRAAERIRLAVRTQRFHDPSLAGVQLTCSIGVSRWPLLPAMRERDLGGAIELADFAMYRVKSRGRDASLALLPGTHATPALLTAPAVDIERLVRTGVLRWQAAAD